MSGYVYAIESGGRIKIGYSEKPEHRFSKVASDAPFPCVLLGYWPGTVADELAIHQLFNSVRLHGEWFAATENLLAFIAARVIPVEPKRYPAKGCEPAGSLIAKFGSVKALAEITGISVHSVGRWRAPKEKGGTGGVVPHWHINSIVAAASAQGIKVSAADFFPVIEESK